MQPNSSPTDASFRVVLFKQPLVGTPHPDSAADDQLERLRVALGRRGAKGLMNLLRLFIAPEAAVNGLSTSQIGKELHITRLTAARYLRVLEEERLLTHASKKLDRPDREVESAAFAGVGFRALVGRCGHFRFAYCIDYLYRFDANLCK